MTPVKNVTKSTNIKSPRRISSQTLEAKKDSTNITSSHQNSSHSYAEQRRRKQYCHYFNNSGHCTFEEKTGQKCKFLHEKAPVCKFNGSCNRKKCMYSHSQSSSLNQPGRSQQAPFLRQVSHQGRGRWQPRPPVWMLQQMWESLANGFMQ